MCSWLSREAADCSTRKTSILGRHEPPPDVPLRYDTVDDEGVRHREFLSGFRGREDRHGTGLTVLGLRKWTDHEQDARLTSTKFMGVGAVRCEELRDPFS